MTKWLVGGARFWCKIAVGSRLWSSDFTVLVLYLVEKQKLGFLVNNLNRIIIWNPELLFEIEFTSELEIFVIEFNMGKMM